MDVGHKINAEKITENSEISNKENTMENNVISNKEDMMENKETYYSQYITGKVENPTQRLSEYLEQLQEAEVILFTKTGKRGEAKARNNVARLKKKIQKELHGNLLLSPVEIREEQRTDNVYQINVKHEKVILAIPEGWYNTGGNEKLELDKNIIELDSRKWFCDSKIFEGSDKTLLDLNGNPIPKDTPNVKVLLCSIKEFKITRAIYRMNIEKLASGDEELTEILNLQEKKFSSIEECARFVGVNNSLDRSIKMKEKIEIAKNSHGKKKITEIEDRSKKLGVAINLLLSFYHSGIHPSRAWLNLLQHEENDNGEIINEILDKLDTLFTGKVEVEDKRNFLLACNRFTRNKLKSLPTRDRLTNILEIVKNIDYEDIKSETIDGILSLLDIPHEEKSQEVDKKN